MQQPLTMSTGVIVRDRRLDAAGPRLRTNSPPWPGGLNVTPSVMTTRRLVHVVDDRPDDLEVRMGLSRRDHPIDQVRRDGRVVVQQQHAARALRPARARCRDCCRPTAPGSSRRAAASPTGTRAPTISIVPSRGAVVDQQDRMSGGRLRLERAQALPRVLQAVVGEDERPDRPHAGTPRDVTRSSARCAACSPLMNDSSVQW